MWLNDIMQRILDSRDYYIRSRMPRVALLAALSVLAFARAAAAGAQRSRGALASRPDLSIPIS
jgi:hypothetical protein